MIKSSFSAKMENLEAMIDFIIDFARDEGISRDKLNHIRLAVEEVLVNVINYAYKDESGIVEIVCAPAEKKGVVIDIIDLGFAFNPLEKEEPDTTLSMEERDIGGLGIFLTKRVMDEVSYERKDGRNILRLKKYA